MIETVAKFLGYGVMVAGGGVAVCGLLYFVHLVQKHMFITIRRRYGGLVDLKQVLDSAFELASAVEADTGAEPSVSLKWRALDRYKAARARLVEPSANSK